MTETISAFIDGPEDRPTLIYVPGIQGDCTLIPALRRALGNDVYWVELTYPQTTGWTLERYASELLECLRQRGIKRGWLLGESFGSQVVFSVVGQCSLDGKNPFFEVEGIVLAGGFVRHPFVPGVHLARILTQYTPAFLLKLLLHIWKFCSQIRVGDDPVRQKSILDFVARRTEEDLQAWVHRLRLISAARLGEVAARSTIPLFAIAGFWDPVVVWPPVRWWLRQHCRGYRKWKTVWSADHTVLFTQPDVSADFIRASMGCRRETEASTV